MPPRTKRDPMYVLRRGILARLRAGEELYTPSKVNSDLDRMLKQWQGRREEAAQQKELEDGYNRIAKQIYDAGKDAEKFGPPLASVPLSPYHPPTYYRHTEPTPTPTPTPTPRAIPSQVAPSPVPTAMPIAQETPPQAVPSPVLAPTPRATPPQLAPSPLPTAMPIAQPPLPEEDSPSLLRRIRGKIGYPEDVPVLDPAIDKAMEEFNRVGLKADEATAKALRALLGAERTAMGALQKPIPGVPSLDLIPEKASRIMSEVLLGAAIPSAGATKLALGTGKIAKTLSAALTPVAKVEEAPGQAISAVARRLRPKTAQAGVPTQAAIPVKTDATGLPITVVTRFPTNEDLMESVFGGKRLVDRLSAKYPALQKGLPTILNVLRNFKYSAAAGTPYAHARVIYGGLQDMSEGAVMAATAKTRYLADRSFVGFRRAIIEIDSTGVVTDKNIRQVRNLPDEKKSMAAHDIIEFSERYEMPDRVRAYVDEIRSTSKKLATMLDDEGIDIVRIEGESDWVYLHRVVREYKAADHNNVANRIVRLLTESDQGDKINWAPGDPPWKFLQQVIRGIDDGSIKTSSKIDDLIEELGKLADIPVTRQSLSEPRFHALVIDGLEAGVKYSANPTEELIAQATAAYRAVTSKRIGLILSEMGTTAPEIARKTLSGRPGDLLESISAKRRSELAGNLLKLTDHAVKSPRSKRMGYLAEPTTKAGPGAPERVISANELAEIKAAFPEEIKDIRRFRASKVRNRKEAGEALKKRMAESKRQADEASETSPYEKALKDIELKAAPGGKDYNTVYNIPGLHGKIIPSQVIEKGGKQLNGDEIEAHIRKTFDFLGKGDQDKVLRGFSEFANIYRLGRLSLDASISLIQLTGSLGLDFFNLIHAPTSFILRQAKIPVRQQAFTATFPKAALRSYWTAIDPKHELHYWMNPDNYAALTQRIKHHSMVQASEFTQGAESIQRLIDRFPLISDRFIKAPAKGVLQQTFGRADAAWSAGRNIAANEQWKAYASIARKEGQLDQLGRITNLTTGVLSLRGMGTSDFKSKFLNAFVFLAPRYTLAQGALVANIFSGGISRELAIKSVVGLIGFNTAFFTLAALALGQSPKIDPRPKKYGGDGADLWTVQIGNRRLGVGGMMYAPLRFIANTASATVDEPGALMKFDGTNPLVRFARSKGAASTGLLYSYLTGRDFLSEPVRELGDFPKANKQTLEWLVKQGMPIWAEELAEEGFAGMAAAAAEFFGFRGHPVSHLDRYRAQIEERDDEGRTFHQIRDSEDGVEKIREIRNRYPDIQETYDLYLADAKRLHWSEARRDVEERISSVKDNHFRNVAEEEQRLFEGKSTYTLKEFRTDIFKNGSSAIKSEYESLRRDKKFAEYFQGLEEYQDEMVLEGSLRALYNEIFYNPDNYDSQGVPLYDKRDAELLALKGEVSAEVWNRLQENLEYEKTLHVPWTLLEYWRILKMPWFKAYYDIPKEVIQDPIMLAAYEALPDFGSAGRADALDKQPWLREVDNLISEQRVFFRKKEPDLDAALFRWGFTNKLVAAEFQSNPLVWEDLLRPWNAAFALGSLEKFEEFEGFDWYVPPTEADTREKVRLYSGAAE